MARLYKEYATRATVSFSSVKLLYIVLLYKNAFRMILATFFNSKEVTPYIILHRVSQIYQDIISLSVFVEHKNQFFNRKI